MKEDFQMIVQLETTRAKLEQNRNSIAESREKVISNKIFNLKDILITSAIIFVAGIALGVAIMQILTH